MLFPTLVALSALPFLQAQNVPPPAPVLLNSTKSGVLPVLPTPFNGTLTLEGAIISKLPANASITPVLGPASTQSSQPTATYVATLPMVPFDGLTGTTVMGTIMASTNGGSGVNFAINFTNFPSVAMYGPFVYHIHDMPVPAGGNCTGTMGHFDPTNAGELYRCAASLGRPDLCQAGDLAGKHGMINGTSLMVSYNDPFLSLNPSSPYFFGNKSITIHTSNTTRLTCANFTMMSTNGSMPTPTTTGGTTMYTGGASKAMVGSASAAVALMFAMFML